MTTLRLTEDDLGSITNALLIAANECSRLALIADNLRIRRAFEQSARQYQALCERVEEADRIEVERAP